MISCRAPVPILISRTTPSNVDSDANDLWKVSDAFGTDTLNAGLSSAVSLTAAGSFANAAFGAEFTVVVVVTQLIAVPDNWFWTQPDGRVGAVTVSNFCARFTTGVPVDMVFVI